MQIISESNLDIRQIINELKNGKTIVYPTETCYGLGCDAYNQIAAHNIFKIKQRQDDKPLLIIVPNVVEAKKFIKWNDALDNLAKKYWPGALTIVGDAVLNSGLAQGVISKDNTVAIRVSNHQLSKKISSLLGRPLVSTSANIASLESPYDVASILGMFEGVDNKPDIIIDAGTLVHNNPSTIVKVNDDGKIQVLRQGDVVVVHSQ